MKNLEIFESEYTECSECGAIDLNCGEIDECTCDSKEQHHKESSQWFYWFCCPGCLPDSEPFGPFDSEALAMQDAEDTHGPDEPEPDEYDAFFTDSGPLGSKTSVSCNGEFVGEFDSYEDAEKALVEYMQANKYFPNIWQVSDHGNHHLTTLDKKGDTQ